MHARHDRSGVYDVAYIARADSVEYLCRALRELFERPCTDTVLTHYLGCQIGRLDVEAEIVEAAYQRDSLLLVLVGKGNDYGAVILHLSTCRDERLVHGTRQLLIITYRFTCRLHFGA